MGAKATYDEAAAGRVRAVAQAWGVLLGLRRVVSANAHAEVFRCVAGEGEFAPSGQSGDVCLKLLHSRRGHLAYLEQVLGAMWDGAADAGGAEAAGAAAAIGAGLPMPRVLRAGRVALPTGEEAFALLTPWVKGVSLAEAIRHEARRHQASSDSLGPLLRDGLAIVAELACVLRDLGNAPGGAVVHGDLKPSNAVVRRLDDAAAAVAAGFADATAEAAAGAEAAARPFRLTVIDYDTVCRAGDAQAPMRCGSFGHAAPERVAWLAAGAGGGADAARFAPQPASDVYSFGVMAHEVLTGHWPYACPPHPGASLQEWARFYRSLGDVPALDAALPADVRQLVAACLSPDPSHRPAPDELACCACALALAHRDDDARCLLVDAAALASIPTASLLWEDAPSPCATASRDADALA